MTVTLRLINCDTCGIQFGVPKEWDAARHQDHKTWYCPNGHQWHYTAESDVSKLERLKRETELKLQSTINEERHLRLVAEKHAESEKRKRRKIEKRIAAGVCPCCNRQFEDLHRHMATKHKEYAIAAPKPKQITEAIQ